MTSTRGRDAHNGTKVQSSPGISGPPPRVASGTRSCMRPEVVSMPTAPMGALRPSEGPRFPLGAGGVPLEQWQRAPLRYSDGGENDCATKVWEARV